MWQTRWDRLAVLEGRNEGINITCVKGRGSVDGKKGGRKEVDILLWRTVVLEIKRGVPVCVASYTTVAISL